jgi:hypothetical protein
MERHRRAGALDERGPNQVRKSALFKLAHYPRLDLFTSLRDPIGLAGNGTQHRLRLWQRNAALKFAVHGFIPPPDG